MGVFTLVHWSFVLAAFLAGVLFGVLCIAIVAANNDRE